MLLVKRAPFIGVAPRPCRHTLAMHTPQPSAVFLIHGPSVVGTSFVLDSPHSGFVMPPDFGAVRSAAELRDGEDCFVDELYGGAVDQGVPLLAAQFPRTYLDANRDAADLDPDLLDVPWPYELRPSGKASIGKALLWRTLDDGRPLYNRLLGAAEVRHRIQHYHRPYHQALLTLLNAAHARCGVVHHINCHSMNPVSGANAADAGQSRADFVLGDRDGSTCAPEFIHFVRNHLQALGYDVRLNDPFKGVELVRAYAQPGQGRHSVQLEINKRLYMDHRTLQKTTGFLRLQDQLAGLIKALRQRFDPPTLA
jgi:N-formylglutamate deformylase